MTQREQRIGLPRSLFARRVIVTALLVIALGPACDSSAFALDGKKKQKKGGAAAAAKEEPAKKTAEQKTLNAIGKEFASKDVDKLLARVPKKGKIVLALGRHDDRFRLSHARAHLDEWFESRTITEVKLKPSKDAKALLATFTLKFRPRKKPKGVVRDLEIRIKPKDKGEGFILTSIKVLSQ